MFAFRGFITISFLLVIFINVLPAQDSTRKFSYFKNDSVLRNKINLTFEGGFQIPKYREFKYTTSNIPSNEGFDNYLLYKEGNISCRKRRTFDACLSANFRLGQKCYLGLGVKCQSFNETIEVHSDSLIYKSQVEFYSVSSENKGNLIQIPFFVQYRINKYFYPFIGYAVNAVALTKRTIRDSEQEFPTYSTSAVFNRKHNEKIAGFDFNIPKANRLYFAFKFVHTGKKWTLRDKDLCYSFGLKYYLI